MALCNGTDFTLRALGFPQKADKKPTKSRSRNGRFPVYFKCSSSVRQSFACRSIAEGSLDGVLCKLEGRPRVSFPHLLSLAAEGALRLPGSAIRSFEEKEEGECFFRLDHRSTRSIFSSPPSGVVIAQFNSVFERKKNP